MGITEIVLLVIGGLFFVISFFLPEGKKKEEEHVTQEEIKALIDKEMTDAKTRIDDMVEETVTYSVEKTERALEKLSNEKIMAVDEFAETVLEKINKNHQETVFLYDMLNAKDEKLKNSEGEMAKNLEEVSSKQEELKAREEQLADRERAAKEAEEAKKLKEEERIRIARERRLEEERLAKEKEAELKAQETFEPLAPETVLVKDGFVVDSTPAPAKPKRSSKAKKETKDNAPIPEVSGFENGQNKNELIIRLHNEGKSNMAIARELGLGVGEVKLVIDLFVSKKGK